MALGTVTIVGVGLIGGSIGKALRARGLARRVVGFGRDPGRLELARSLGAIDDGRTHAAEAFAEADFTVVCTPVSRVAGDVMLAARHGPLGQLITDAGSTKREIVAEVESDARVCGRFVGAHPIAGSERSGVSHARADLFEGAVCVVTPTERTPMEVVLGVESFWEGLGCRVTRLSPSEHDEALAAVSHLPHVVAAALLRQVAARWLDLGGGALRDGTRVASSDAALWTDIFLANRAHLRGALDRFEAELDGFRALLEAGDRAGLLAWWDAARGCRERGKASEPGKGVFLNTFNNLDA